MQKNIKSKVIIASILLILIGFGAVVFGSMFFVEKEVEQPAKEPVIEEIEPEVILPPPIEEEPEEEILTIGFVTEDDGLPHDKLFITPERQMYNSYDMRLIIPKLDVDIPILDGVDEATLNSGEGLYDYAQLPGEGNRNVSIAGHRNGISYGQVTDNMPFYYIDTLEDGDCLYLMDYENIYRYVWDRTTIVEETDWGPIYSQGFSCLTLTSCEPIGIADHRIIVRAALAEIIPYTEDYEYPEVFETEVRTPADLEDEQVSDIQ